MFQSTVERKNSVSSAPNSASSATELGEITWPTNKRPKRNLLSSLDSPRNLVMANKKITHWDRCLKPCSPLLRGILLAAAKPSQTQKGRHANTDALAFRWTRFDMSLRDGLKHNYDHFWTHLVEPHLPVGFHVLLHTNAYHMQLLRQWNTEFKHNGFSSDTPSMADLMCCQLQNVLENHGRGCCWAVPDSLHTNAFDGSYFDTNGLKTRRHAVYLCFQ